MYLVDISYKLGSQINTNEQVEKEYGLKPGFVLEKTGIQKRAHFSADENPIDIAASLAKNILSKNSVNETDNIVVYGSSNPYSALQIPSATHEITYLAGLKNVGVHHVNYGCGGYVAGFQDMNNFLKNSPAPTYALFVLSDHPSKMVRDYNTAVLFSDAVCVSLWSNSSEYSNRPSVDNVFYSNVLDNPEALNVHDGYWEMDGSLVSSFVRKVPEVIQNKLAISLSDYIVIPHQANPALLETLEKEYGASFYKDDATSFGNTTCSALFIAIANNLSSNKNKDFLCIGFGDTESYGAFVLKTGR